MDVRDCEDEKLGIMLKKIPLISMELGHTRAKDTIKDYIMPGNDVNAMFIKDLFTLTTVEVIDKWYGGEDNAYDLLSKLTDIIKEPDNE